MKTFSDLLQTGTPFLFYTDYQGKNVHLYTLDELEKEDIDYTIALDTFHSHSAQLQKFPLDFPTYQKGFDQIIEKIKAGETYLLNYTCSTPVNTTLDFKEIFALANAPFKLRVKDEFVCFSPERFIRIEDNEIFTYPMKGTIDASLPEAKETILSNEKEMAEHVMVVDLLRNDLSMIASNVRVNQFRYIDKIKAGEKELLQVSSEISAQLPENWKANFETLLHKLLPAGSISGTPKKSTLEIIHKVEDHERNYFSGVFGVFDGKVLDSAVMIRFLESTPSSHHTKEHKYIYKSGGGITLESDAQAEYQEMLDKIYIP